MKQKKDKKSGFTLVELMVVAIIVAILAAVAIPLMSGNRDRAIATEAQAGCSTLAMAQRVAKAQYGTYTNVAAISDLPGISNGDLDGTYFDDDSYVFSGVTASRFNLTATARPGAPDGVAGETVIMRVRNGATTWAGTLVD